MHAGKQSDSREIEKGRKPGGLQGGIMEGMGKREKTFFSEDSFVF